MFWHGSAVRDTVFYSAQKRQLGVKKKNGEKNNPQKTFQPSFVPVLNGKICTLFSAVVAKLNHFQSFALLNHRLHPRRAAECDAESKTVPGPET